VLIFLAVGALYSLVTPIFEASDELSHYPVVKHIADGRGLIVQNREAETAWKQEGSQPPLYYVIAALATAWIDTGDLEALLWENPHVNIGKPLAHGNKNLVIHTERATFPWQGTALAVHLIRWLSLLMQAMTVLLTWRLAREIAPGRRDFALAAAALVAFNPMFLFIAASVNNDNLIVPLATLVLWLLVRTLKHSWIDNRGAILLGALLGMAVLTKLSGLALLPLAAGVLAIVAIRRRAWGALARWGIIVSVLVAVIAGWWYVRNWRLYGDPTGLSAMLEIAGRRPESPSLCELLGELRGLLMSYWGVFGGFNVVAPKWLYHVYEAVTLVGLVGWLPLAFRLGNRQRLPQARLLCVLVAWIVLMLVSLIRWTSVTYASQGRLLFPAISALSVLLAGGLVGWLPGRWQKQSYGAVVAGLGLSAILLPFVIIAPAYARPRLLTADQAPPAAQRADITYAGVLRMLAYELPQQTVRPGESLPVTVYWELVAETDQDFSVFVHLLGRGLEPAGQIGTYPGLGAYPTSLLRPGNVLRDTYVVPVAISTSTPSLLRVDVGLYEYNRGDEIGLPTVNSEGQTPTGMMGTVRMLPHKPATYAPSRPLHFELGSQVVLLGYDLASQPVRPGDVIELTLYWQAQVRMTDDYHVFVHLVDPRSGGEPAAQGDKAPLDGDWPTWAWEPGHPIRDDYRIHLPATLVPAEYELRVGLYRLRDGWRLPVAGPAGSHKDSAIVLTQVEVR
jgi:4-amino-4-deoxy-L-arabinose transferase-like glycosyltransferase